MQKTTMQSLSIATAGTQQAQSASPSEQVVSVHPTHQEIAARAYDLYISSGLQPGHCKRNWQQAEHELCHPAHASL